MIKDLIERLKLFLWPKKTDAEELIRDGIKQSELSGDQNGLISGSEPNLFSKTYTTFSGADTHIFITDEPFEITKLKEYKTWGSIQLASWIIKSIGTSGTFIELDLDGRRSPDLEGKNVTVFSANEYGKATVIAAFFIHSVESISSGFSIDDLIIERRIDWKGDYLPNLVGPVEKPNDT